MLLVIFATSLPDRRLRLLAALPGGGGAAGAGVLGALLPGNAGGGGPGLVHPVARPQQPGGGAAAAAAQRAVGQRPPQQPGGSGGGLTGEATEQSVSSLILEFWINSAFPLQRKSILNPEAKEFIPGKKY